MRRLCLLALLVAACSSHDHSGDPAVGRWSNDRKHIIELRTDGSLDVIPVIDRECDTESALIASCTAKQRWSRAGATVTLELGSITRRRPLSFEGWGPCECHVEPNDVELRGDELVKGTERLQRVVEPKPARDPAP